MSLFRFACTGARAKALGWCAACMGGLLWPALAFSDVVASAPRTALAKPLVRSASLDLDSPISFEFSTFWIDETHIGFNFRDYSLVWNVETDTREVFQKKRIECVDFDKSPAEVLFSELPRGKPKSLGGAGVVYFRGSYNSAVQVISEDPPPGIFVRDRRLADGAEVTQRQVGRNLLTNCEPKWVPTESTPPHMREALKKNWPLFGGKLVFDLVSASARPREKISLVVESRPEPIVLPVSFCELYATWGAIVNNSYYPFKRAYLAMGAKDYYPNGEKGCGRSVTIDEPLRYHWLLEDGSLESGNLPPFNKIPDVYFFESGGAGGPPAAAGRSISEPLRHFYATATGFVYLFNDDRHRKVLYRATDSGYEPIYRSSRRLSVPVVSPLGCRLAFAEPNLFSSTATMRIVDFCK